MKSSTFMTVGIAANFLMVAIAVASDSSVSLCTLWFINLASGFIAGRLQQEEIEAELAREFPEEPEQ